MADEEALKEKRYECIIDTIQVKGMGGTEMEVDTFEYTMDRLPRYKAAGPVGDIIQGTIIVWPSNKLNMN